ncbi:Hvo_1808 family surface protein [Haloferacaceae archaeon DSL9]
MQRFLTICLVVLMVTAGFAPAGAAVGVAPAADAAGSGAPLTAIDRPLLDAGVVAQADESSLGDEPLGCVNGICHDDDPDIDQSDGLDDAELEQYVSLSMARVEYIRERKFSEEVDVTVMTREEYIEMTGGGAGGGSAEYNRWNDQVWKGLFIIGDDQGSGDAIGETLGGAVAGFYSPASGEIVIITPDGDAPVVDDVTLVHELVHAMQDQYHDLTSPQYRGMTQDADLGVNGIVEGEAVYVEKQYVERCESGEWQCVEAPADAEPDGGSADAPMSGNLGVLLVLYQPYSDGPGYVHDIVESEGWDGVDARMEEPPRSSAEVIHRDDREPESFEFEDEARNGWELYSNQGVNGSDTVGEASIYAMFWYQAREHDADTIDPQTLGATNHPYEEFNYVSEPSSGWVYDRLYPYQNGEDGDGYVWVTEWETDEDAETFAATYQRMLEAHDVSEGDRGTLVIDDGGFAGAYAIDVDGTTVTIVHAASADEVYDIRPSVEGTATAPEPAQSESDDGMPGFGVAAAAAALAAAAVLLRRR